MIDFNNNSVFKLKKVESSKFDSEMQDILIDDERSSDAIRMSEIMLSSLTRE